MLYSEMVATKSAIHGDREKILGFRNEEHPVALQVGGSDKDELADGDGVENFFQIVCLRHDFLRSLDRG